LIMTYAWPRMFTRQELADALGMSYDALCRNEKRLGLDGCRVVINQRVLFYREDLVVVALVKSGLIIQLAGNGTETPDQTVTLSSVRGAVKEKP